MPVFPPSPAVLWISARQCPLGVWDFPPPQPAKYAHQGHKSKVTFRTFGDPIAVGIGKVLKILSFLFCFVLFASEPWLPLQLRLQNLKEPPPSQFSACPFVKWHEWGTFRRIFIISLLSFKNICSLFLSIYLQGLLPVFCQMAVRTVVNNKTGRGTEQQHKTGVFFRVISWGGGDFRDMVNSWTLRAFRLWLNCMWCERSVTGFPKGISYISSCGRSHFDQGHVTLGRGCWPFLCAVSS